MPKRPSKCRTAAWLSVAVAALATPAVPSSPLWFEDGTAAAGIDFVHANGAAGDKHITETMGSGAAFFDADGDGRPDLYLANSAAPSALFRNGGAGRFRRDPGNAADAGYAMGCVAGDADGDGDEDLYVTAYGPNHLFANDGSGRFADVTQAAGVGDPRLSSGAAFGDIDLDGDLDLYVANYVVFGSESNPRCVRNDTIRVYCGPESFAPAPDAMFRNLGDGTFEDVADAVGLRPAAAKELGALFSDIDADGDVDLYVAGDRTANLLYVNDAGRFAESSLLWGTAYNEAGKPEAGMGIDAGDVDDDGRTDLFVTNFLWESNTLYRNEGGGFFADVTAVSELMAPSTPYMGWGTHLIDADNDGDRDLFVANGHLDDNVELFDRSTYAQRNQLFRNDGGRFTEVTAQAGPGLALVQVSRGTAVADVDGDGDLDIAVNNNGQPAALLRNDGGAGAGWLRVRLPPSAIGARVRVRLGERWLHGELRSGGSYLGHSETVVHFGLGGHAGTDEIVVHWPGGRTTTTGPATAGEEIRIE